MFNQSEESVRSDERSIAFALMSKALGMARNSEKQCRNASTSILDDL